MLRTSLLRHLDGYLLVLVKFSRLGIRLFPFGINHLGNHLHLIGRNPLDFLTEFLGSLTTAIHGVLCHDFCLVIEVGRNGTLLLDLLGLG